MEIFYDPNEILQFWFPNPQYQKWWFISNLKLDQHISEKYYKQMEKLFDGFSIDNYLNAQPKKIITDIILLDQFSRNISRVKNEEDIDIQAYTKKAELLSEIWLGKKYYLTEQIEYTVFALLPIRHSKDKNKIKKLIPILDEILFTYFKIYPIEKFIYCWDAIVPTATD